jgi:very-short-patch-repair endonuclease
MGWAEVFDDVDRRVVDRDLLIAYGATGRSLTAAVKTGQLIRARRNHYVLPNASRPLVEAVRVGGRLGCISALAEMEVFALDARFTHIHLEHTMSRLRSPRNRFLPLSECSRDGTELHWWPLASAADATEYSVGVFDALLQSLHCQSPWLSLASIDNARFAGKLPKAAVPRLFEAAPDRVRFLERHVDPLAEAGQETILRMIAKSAGLHCELQQQIPGVGRVDLIVEGCLALEADSRLAHDGWEKHVADRHRDLVLAKNGYMSLRPAYQHTMYEPALVRESILGLLAQSRNFARAIL